MTKDPNSKDALKSKGRRESIKNATPACLSTTELNKIKRLYEYAKHVTTTSGMEYQVDHIIPLSNPLVCGLHVPANLQVITSEQNKAKGNDLRLEPEVGAFTITDIQEFMSLRDKGKFMKGVSGNVNGRPKGTSKMKKAIEAIDADVLGDLYDAADGDAMRFLNLVLKNGRKLDLGLDVGMRLARELAPYQSPRKASIETKEERTTQYIVQFDNHKQLNSDIKDALDIESEVLHNEDVTKENNND